MKLSGNTILITGGGSGIGRELARRFHALGNIVIVAGRTEATLQETIAGRDGMHILTFDAGDASDIRRFAKELLAKHPSVNVLINNAGIMKVEDLAADEVDVSIAETTIATNLLGPIRLTSALLPHLRATPDAVIMNVTSGLAFVPLAWTPTYSATKAGLHSWTQSLRYRLKDEGVEVIEIAPPGVQTDLTPGQSTRENYVPLADYIDSTMKNFETVPTPAENIIAPATFLRTAEANGNFGELFNMLNTAYAAHL